MFFDVLPQEYLSFRLFTLTVNCSSGDADAGMSGESCAATIPEAQRVLLKHPANPFMSLRVGVAACLAIGLSANLRAESGVTGESIHLGTMDGFYRFQPVLGEWMATDLAIREIPAWMQETDFPYQKRPYAKEIAFADGLTCVRLLSGRVKAGEEKAGHPGDLAYRDATGQVRYRWNLLKERLDPYISLGYKDLTLVMDNVPWCFPSKPVQAEYGQIAPPANYAEWHRFIRELCRELKRLYGEETVRNFRFRMGTEMQDERRFLGGFEEYLKYYDYAAAAVKTEIPEARFGPFNRSNPVGRAGPDAETVNMVELARHCLTGTNRVTGEIGSPFDFFARSFYYFSSEPQPGRFENIHPDQRVPAIRQLWDEVEALDPRFAGLPREVHEFGPHLQTEGGIYGLDTGARGAAQAFHTIMALKEAGADRIWHWNIFEDIEKDNGRSLLYGQGWLYAIFDHMRGGQLYTLPVTADGDTTNSQKAAISILKDRAILIVANWNMDRTKHESNKLTVQIPDGILPAAPASVQMLSLTETNSVYDVLRRDLKAAGLLSEKHRQHRGAPATTVIAGGYNSMAVDKDAGRVLILDDWQKYESLMRDSLTLRPFPGRVSSAGGAIEVYFMAQCPSVSVIVLDRKAR